MNAIELKNISKKYGDNKIFDHYNLEVKQGTFLGIKGRSGRGKTTLLNIMGLLEDYEGSLKVMGEEVKPKNKKKRKELLENVIGYLFQNYALIDDASVYENLKIVSKEKNKKKEKARMLDALEKVGVAGDYLNKKIYTCSGGEQQRIAVARLMLKNCEIVLADEPTGSLDEKNTEIVMKLLTQLNESGKTIVMVSHDDAALSYCKEVIQI
ncbi:ATP-binding cassette domain-containing protein [Eubacterium oxidoreducens]|uniref:Putative ABC transport system ATP-binding protein n=1 Tax=Eubacterium oxidoreducens TaxID=1732 RepID=A0A1G6CTD4_EUBOX|nr:ATP-binding cassette domain-containing protein [Eubacterium oxidoreducens]SDB36153.1 putative ABC transport system ATP-binding protein [Eubacterium oxidoreducens]